MCIYIYIYIYIHNFFLTVSDRCVNCYGVGIAGANELKNLSQWLFTSLKYLICFCWYIGKVSNISFGWYWRMCGSSWHRSLPQIWQSWQTKIKKDNCVICKQKNLKNINKKNLGKIDCRKIFASENLTPMNQSIAYSCLKLKCNGLIQDSFSRDGTIRIKHEERARSLKIFRIDKLYQFFADFDFGDADEDEGIFQDASQVANDYVQSSY